VRRRTTHFAWLAAVAATAFLISACSAGAPAGSGGPVCKNGRTAPLTKTKTVTALARHGIRLYSERRSELCGASDIYVDLTNIGTTSDEEGLIDCVLRASPLYPNVSRWVLSKDATAGNKVEFYLANAECSIYPRGARGEEQGRNLEAALKELETDLRRQG
jgi:hypothetical protein